MTFDYRPYWDRSQIHAIDLVGPSDRDLIVRKIEQAGTFYEHELLEHLAMRGPRGGLFLDIGANLGNHAVFFGKFMADHVACVEASPDLRPILRQNLDANGLSHARILACAAGAQPGTAHFHLPQHAQLNTGMGVVTSDGEGVEVAVRPVDDLANDLADMGPIQLMKIDVEGMQLDVLRGARRVLEQDRPQLVVEAATRQEQVELFDLIEPYGYTVAATLCSTATFHCICPACHTLRPVSTRYRIGEALSAGRRSLGRIKRSLAA